MIRVVERKEYLERLIQWKDEQVIKVVTGIRRCGKSTLLRSINRMNDLVGMAESKWGF